MKKIHLDTRKHEVSQSTLDGYHYRLKHFIRWCEPEGIDNTNDLSGRDLYRFKTWHRDDGDLTPLSLGSQLDTLRMFIRWCESIDAVEEKLHKITDTPIPTLIKSPLALRGLLSGLGFATSFRHRSRRLQQAHRSLDRLWRWSRHHCWTPVVSSR